MLDPDPRTKLSPEQSRVLEQFVGELLEDGYLIGDEHDLIEILTNIAGEYFEYGNWSRAYEVAKLLPNRSSITYEDFKASFENVHLD